MKVYSCWKQCAFQRNLFSAIYRFSSHSENRARLTRKRFSSFFYSRRVNTTQKEGKIFAIDQLKKQANENTEKNGAASSCRIRWKGHVRIWFETQLAGSGCCWWWKRNQNWNHHHGNYMCKSSQIKLMRTEPNKSEIDLQMYQNPKCYQLSDKSHVLSDKWRKRSSLTLSRRLFRSRSHLDFK